MTTDLVQGSAGYGGGPKYTGPILDTDIHETFTSLQDLVPYLKEPWRGLIVRKAWTGIVPPVAYWASHFRLLSIN